MTEGGFDVTPGAAAAAAVEVASLICGGDEKSDPDF